MFLHGSPRAGLRAMGVGRDVGASRRDVFIFSTFSSFSEILILLRPTRKKLTHLAGCGYQEAASLNARKYIRHFLERSPIMQCVHVLVSLSTRRMKGRLRNHALGFSVKNTRAASAWLCFTQLFAILSADARFLFLTVFAFK